MYKLFYSDNTTVTGKSLDGSWRTVSNNLLIKRLEYHYTYSKKLVLEGYKEYNHLVEKMANLKGQILVSKILIIGRNEETSDIFTIDLRTRKITKETAIIGKEYQTSIINGWKQGEFKTPRWYEE